MTSTTSSGPAWKTILIAETKFWHERGWPDEIRRAIMSHAEYSGVTRDTPMEKALFRLRRAGRIHYGMHPGEAKQIIGRS